MSTVLYGLQEVKTGKLLKWFLTGGDETRTWELPSNGMGDEPWLVDSPEKAQRALKKPPKYWNSSFNSPVHNFKPNEVKVVPVSITIMEEKH